MSPQSATSISLQSSRFEWRRLALRLAASRAISVGFLAAAAAIAALWRVFVARPLVASDEQLNLATFVVAHANPPFLAADFAYGSSDPSRFYTPLQVGLFDLFWKLAGSIDGAVATQAVPVVALTIVIAALSVYLLTRRIIAAAVVAAAALSYRVILSAGEIWGVGPSWALLPRAWAAPLSFAVIAVWLRALESNTLRTYAWCGLLSGLALDVHPPTGLPLTAAIVGATWLRTLVGARTWRGPATLSLAAALVAIPFAGQYLTVGTSSAPADYDSFMAAARLRVDTTVLPHLGNTLSLSLTPGTDGFAANAALAAASVITLVFARPTRSRITSLVLLTGMLLGVSVFVPVVAQEVLMQLRKSPMSTVDTLRGIRLVIPVALVFCGLGVGSALDSGGRRSCITIPIAALLLVDSSVWDYVATVASWSVIAVVVLSGSAIAWIVVRSLRSPQRPALVSAGIVAVLLTLLPILGIVVAPRTAGLCCAIPPRPAEERATDELIDWARTLPTDTVVDTSNVQESAALRLRIESEHPVTFIAKDGNVLLYSDPTRAVLWAMRAERQRKIAETGDVEALRNAAKDWGASVVLVDRLVWPGSVTGTTLTISWSGIQGPTAKDWVGLWAIGDPDADVTRIAVRYTGGTKDGQVGLTFPTPSSPKIFEVRLFANDTWTRIATSAPITVSGNGASSAQPQRQTGPAVSVSWAGTTAPIFENSRFTAFKP